LIIVNILDQLKAWTPDKLDGRSDFDDMPAPVYRPRVAREMVHVVDATAGERKATAKLRGPVNTNTDYANPKIDTRPFQDEAGQPSKPQRELIVKLTGELMALDTAMGTQAADYAVRMTTNQAWTRGKTGNASAWITRLIAKIHDVKATAPAPAAAAPATAAPKFDTFDDVTDGNYAIERGGKTHFYRVTRKEGKGQYAGRTFLNVQERASEELFNVRGAWAVRKAIFDEIRRAGVEASHLLFSERLGRCWHCNTLLTDDATNPYRRYGLGPVCGPKVMG
jgi:hypothetical protein